MRAPAIVLALASAACASHSPNFLSENGGAFVARGVLDAAGVLGNGCPERSLAHSRNVMECGSGAGGLTRGVEMANLGVSVARAALGAAMWALGEHDATTQLAPSAAHSSGELDQALDVSRARMGLEARSSVRPTCDEKTCRAALMPARLRVRNP